MDTQYTIFIAVAAGAFAVALLGVLAQWLKADDAALDAEVGVREAMRRLEEQAHGTTARHAAVVQGEAWTPDQPGYSLGDDETALSRLLLGWTTVGTLTGLAIGAAIWGPVGALLGGIVLATMSVIGVMVAVAIVDRVRARAARDRRAASERPGEPHTARPAEATA